MAEQLRAASAGGAPSEPLDGTDAAGAVSVTLAPGTRRVVRVAVAADWRDRIAPEALSAAVLEAVLRPQLEAMAALPVGFSLPAFAVPPPERALDPEQQRQARVFLDKVGALGDSGLDEMMASVSNALGLLDRTLGELARRTGPPDATVPEGVSDNRRVTVRLSGGQPQAVEVDAAWAAGAGRQQLSDALSQAFAAAYSAADAGRQAPTQAPAGLAEAVHDLQGVLDRMGVWPTDPQEGRR